MGEASRTNLSLKRPLPINATCLIRNAIPLNQAIIVHAALQRANRRAEADRFALDYIVGPLNRAGLYQTLLDKYLPDICRSEDLETKAKALGQTGKQYLHLGGYDTALGFLQQSLAISREIGDKSGEGATLNNISQIYKARGNYDTALDFLQQSLAISREIRDRSGESMNLNNMATNCPCPRGL